jgi:hypothetical protein
MKTLITALAMTVLVAGIGAANAADQQATGAEMDYQLSKEVAGSPAYASAREPGHIVTGKIVAVPLQDDFQLQGR